MSPKFCPYCGNPVKQTDKFCIICGKPMLTDIPKSEKKPEITEVKKEKEIQVIEEKQEDIQPEEEAIEIQTKEEQKITLKKTKEKKEVKPLPDTVKEQIDFYIDYNDVQLNKTILGEKLTELSKSTKDARYEYDLDFKKDVNIKLEALKTLISELKEKEMEVKQNLEDPFIVQRINSDIEKKIFQLENLTREHKLKKVDRESFEKLRDKYKQEKESLEQERDDLVSGMKLWIQDLKLEKTEISGERKLTKGRLHSKELTEEEFKKTDKEFDLRLKKIDAKIKTLEKLTK
ncbi:MAG: zinc ribbon domain-containing protein [Candidatus Odinarchaeota archaeon]